MKERKQNECGNKSQTRVNSGSRPPNGNRQRDDTLYTSHRRKFKRRVAKPNAPQATFKWDEAEGALAQALREAGL
ncbi:hypothetical protein NVP1293O_72 [Vibrio phage 1.293.O._10N.261.52.E1]|nr:hypothetical protein NVP1293O_72 [Vibrio phage 1.293.O._10N.261.52.E1]